MRIGILSAGGDCPGINATIRGIGKTAIFEYGMEVVGIYNGFTGLVNKEVVRLNENMLSRILTLGGTILGTSRMKPFKVEEGDTVADKPGTIVQNYKELELDGLICIGGNGTQKTAHQLSELGLNIIGIPKTIDNDVFGTDVTFGFDTAVNIISDGIDRLHTTANSHKRVMVIETMGHNAGWLALYAGMASGGDVILIPEIPYDLDAVAHTVLERNRKGKFYSIIVVAEGIEHSSKKSAGAYIAKKINKLTGLETRETILGYIQRGGNPSPYDRILATRFGSEATELVRRGEFGRMIALVNNEITSVPLSDVGGKTKLVDPNHNLVVRAKKMGVTFGEPLI